MPMRADTVFAAIEAIAPLSGAADWDRSGLQVASDRREFHCLAVCLDPSPASVRTALSQGADCILSHHPLALKPDLPRRCDAYRETLRLLLTADAALYAAHTSLDVVADGPAAWLADALELRDRQVLEPVGHASAQTMRGYGLVGEMPEAQDFAHFNARLSALLRYAGGTLCGPQPGRIARVAYCTGSGSSLWPLAKAAGADVFITGDVKYHTALDTEIPLLDVGHHSLEEEMARRMGTLLEARLAELRVIFVPSFSPLRPRCMVSPASGASTHATGAFAEPRTSSSQGVMP